MKQGKWVERRDEIKGVSRATSRRVNTRIIVVRGTWRIYSLQGDLTALEFYKWGNKDGVCQYFNASGSLVREESWRALNPDKLYDTLEIEDIDHLNEYKNGHCKK
ncbi:MAG: hypothetical protein WDM78_00695 [Puia sp.]